MVVPGYDPEDLDDALETRLSPAEIQTYLTAEDWEAYQSGTVSLLDLLESSEIRELLEAPEDASDPDT